MAVSSGESQANFLSVQLWMPRCVSFGLLHRIPPQPVDRTPGAMPIELQDQYDEKESNLFVPADARSREQTISDSSLDGTRHSSRVAVSGGSPYIEQNGRS